MSAVRRVTVASVLAVAGLMASVAGSGALASTPPSIPPPAPVSAHNQSDYLLCVGNAPVWVLNFCEY